MKTKILSKLMLVGFTAVMIVGCKDKKKEMKIAETTASPERCQVCDQRDDHIINRDTVARLIRDFHNKVIRGGKIANAGGFLSTIVNPHFIQDSVKNLNNYKTFKLHWAVEDTTENRQRLFVTLEPSDRECSTSNRYSGILGFQDDNLQSTFGVNDVNAFAPPDEELTTTRVLQSLQSGFKVIPERDYYRRVSKDEAISLEDAFQNHTDLFGLYQCKDIVFNKQKSLDEITPQSNRSFFYFFGYDEKQTYHRLRLIIAGYTVSGNEYRINFFDVTTGASLFRETSRPRP